MLLAAAHHEPSAPAVTGEDTQRYMRLEELISQQTSRSTLHQVTTLARALPRAQVVDRALATIDSLARSTLPPTSDPRMPPPIWRHLAVHQAI